MEKITTKDRILKEALILFSEKGYSAVSVAEIADAVGIKAPSLYKHYKSKRDIFDAIVAEMDKQYEEHVMSMDMHFKDADKDNKMFAELTEDKLIEKVTEVFEYALHDEFVSRFRKLITIEQFHDKSLASLYTERYVDSKITYHENLFRLLQKQGVLKNEDTYIMAVQYVSPIIMMIELCQREPDKEVDALNIIKNHIRQFNRLYREVDKQ